MANNVFANGREIACKKGSGKSICAFPDVVWTPPDKVPPTPTGVPVPYPNTAMASDTSKGTKKVKVSGKEAMLKNSSNFKKSMGDEAGVAQLKGFMTMKNRGKIYFQMWSMDVKFEGKNVVRHFDIATHNHGSQVGNTPPWPYLDTLDTVFDNLNECDEVKDAINKKCSNDGQGSDLCPGSLINKVGRQREDADRSLPDSRTRQAGTQATTDAESSDCVKAMRCHLRPYNPESIDDGGCCPGQSPHHIPPKSMMKGINGYSMGKALCVCLEGASQHVGSHGENHAAIDHVAKKKGVSSGTCSLKDYIEVCAIAVEAQCGCPKKCIQEQLEKSSPCDENLDQNVTHWQSNSKQLSSSTQDSIDAVFNADATTTVTR